LTGKRRRARTTRVRAADDPARIPYTAATCPPIVDAATWQAAIDAMAVRQRTATRNNQHPEQALLRTGFAVCHYCGGMLYVTSRRHGKAYDYHCRNASNKRLGIGLRVPPCPVATQSMRCDALDAQVWERVVAALTTPGLLQRGIERWAAARGTQDEQEAANIRACEGVLARLLTAKERLRRAITVADDEDTVDDLTAQLSETNRQIRNQEATLTAARAVQAGTANYARQLKSLADLVAVASSSIADWSYTEKRLALRLLGVQVRVYRAGDPERPTEPDGTRTRFALIFGFDGVNAGQGAQALTGADCVADCEYVAIPVSLPETIR
jgi:site-specific DNA recombinase